MIIVKGFASNNFFAHFGLFLAVGVLGGFTTFSAFSYETMRLLANGSVAASLLNVAGQFTVGLLAVYVGFAAARSLA